MKKRYFRIENYFHHTSKFIINYCKKYDISKLIIGYNEGWKQGSNLGKRNNQNFQFLPLLKLIQKIQYKCLLEGIEMILTEESYTSKASALHQDYLPCYGDKNKNIPKFSGIRKKGRYTYKDGTMINSDVNGSLNIGRKVIHEWVVDRSLVARPSKVNPLKIFRVE